MIRWKNQFWYNPEASKFHESFRQVLVNELPFQNFSCYQEVNVKSLIPDYPHRNHHFDWYIKELGLVVELHGAQHYTPINYGNIGFDDLLVQFNRMKFRDSEKAHAAQENGFHYIAIPYTVEKDLSAKLLMSYLSREVSNG